MVMLTLTRDNMDQVLKLADQLNGLTDLFTFNRLAAVGRGAELSAVPVDRFPDFLARYMAAAETNPCIGLKDNLFNLLRWQQGLSPGGGCAGHGCGAAFNFLTLLPDGEVHACRKFPSPIGHIDRQPLARVREKDRVPVWIVFDRFYVTGSLSAYVALASAAPPAKSNVGRAGSPTLRSNSPLT